jgi:hypothetical protein
MSHEHCFNRGLQQPSSATRGGLAIVELFHSTAGWVVAKRIVCRSGAAGRVAPAGSKQWVKNAAVPAVVREVGRDGGR